MLLIIMWQGPPGERGQDGLPGDPVSVSSPFYKLNWCENRSDRLQKASQS